MIKMKQLLFYMIILCFLFSSGSAQKVADNKLTRKEKKAGWILLFDGKTLEEWRVMGDSVMQSAAGWGVEDNCLKVKWDNAGGNKNIITKREFADFEFSIEWKLSAASNSGIIYHYGDEFTQVPVCTGPEYQIIDDLGWPVELTEDHFTGVDYEMHLPDKTKKKLNPVGEFNHSKIIFNKGHVEHWLNGQKILEFEAWTPDWYERLEKSRWKTSRCYGTNKSGAFMLQNYRNCNVWFKNIKVRPL
jgi:hypothetical protein